MIKKLLIFVFIFFSLFAKDYKRIVILNPAATETVYMLGGQERIVAIANSTMTPIVPVEKTRELPNVGTLLKPSLEQIISYKPDIVIVGNFHTKILDSLDKFNIPYIILKADSLTTMLDNILLLGEIVGREVEAKKLYKDSYARLDSLKKSLEEKPLNLKGTFIYNSSPLMAFSGKSVQSEILTSLGVKDLAKNLTGQRPILSPEYILKEDPDFLIGIMGIKSMDDLIRSNEYLTKTKAGKEKNIYILNSNRLLRMSPHIIDEIEEIHRFLSGIQ